MPLQKNMMSRQLGIFCRCIAQHLIIFPQLCITGQCLSVTFVGHCLNPLNNTKILDEMQSKFGDSALWIYELLRWVIDGVLCGDFRSNTSLQRH